MHWLTTADVYAGREQMNLSRWGRYRTGEKIAKLNAILRHGPETENASLVLPAAESPHFVVPR